MGRLGGAGLGVPREDKAAPSWGRASRTWTDGWSGVIISGLAKRQAQAPRTGQMERDLSQAVTRGED